MTRRQLRLRFWLAIMDACQLCGGHGCRLYMFALDRASRCVGGIRW